MLFIEWWHVELPCILLLIVGIGIFGFLACAQEEIVPADTHTISYRVFGALWSPGFVVNCLYKFAARQQVLNACLFLQQKDGGPNR